MNKLLPKFVVGALITLLAGSTTALAVSRSVSSTQLKAAITAESRVVALLRQYASTNTWAAQLKSAEAVQSRALGRVNATLFPPKPPTSTGLLPGVAPTQKVVDFKGDVYSVTILRVWDVDNQSGTRYVATKISIDDTGKAAINDLADNDIQLVGSNRNLFHVNNDGDYVNGCSDFADGNFDLDPGGTAIGCQVFEVPVGVTVVKVEWVPNSGNGPQVYSWAVKV